MDLVVGASTASMDSLLSKLGNLLAQEYSLIRGVRGDIQYISDELASMKAFLLDLARGDQDNRKKDWVKQIRDMAYDCEDCIDNFAHRLPNDSNFDAKCCPSIAKLIYDLSTYGPRREIASNIAELKVRAQLIAERRVRYGVKNPKINKDDDSEDSADTYDIPEDQLASRQLIGMKEPVGVKAVIENLEKWVINKSVEKRTVLSIVGFGGVGKTTIALALYRRVMNEFQCRASVTVSQNYNKETILRDILKQVQPDDSDHKHQVRTIEKSSTFKGAVLFGKGQKNRQQSNDENSVVKQIETMDYEQLKQALTAHMSDKRYIILVDDIWSKETWDIISRSLPYNNICSRIIVTSRFHAVGATCCPDGNDKLHPIGFLNDFDSKYLFDRSVSESSSTKYRDNIQNHVPEDLWRRCGGQPLAIVTLAGFVACNQNKPEKFWHKFCKLLPEQASSLTDDGGPSQMNSLTFDGVRKILDCCYNNLLGDLKTCLLYLSIFPKGWKISRKCLTRRWIAEGFVVEKQGLTKEEVAETYINQLLRRKLIRPVEHSSNGKLKTFQVHDMVLEYIVSKAREENFITVVGSHWMMAAPSNKVRRLSMQNSSSKHGDSIKGMNLAQVRSLTVFGSLTQLQFQSFNDRIIQVLDFDGLKGLRNKHLNAICKMLVLKYLSLRRTGITEIPSAIGKLEYLETLDIRDTKVKELPKAVEQLKLISSILGGSKNPRKGLRLPQENGKRHHKRQDKEKDGMKALRILSGIEIDETTAVTGLHQLTALKKLTIYKLNVVGKDKNKTEAFFTELLSSIEYLCSCGLQTLAINDEGSLDSEKNDEGSLASEKNDEGLHFINSLNDMSAPPRYLTTLELSGMLNSPPEWIKRLQILTKLTLPVTVLRTDTFKLLGSLKLLFSLTFSLGSAKQHHKAIIDILEKNKSQYDGEIFVPGDHCIKESQYDGEIIALKNLKLLRIFASHVPKLGFSHNAMPQLEVIEMRFKTFEGLFGIDTLENLKGVHLRETKMGQKDQDAKINELLVADLKDSIEGLEIIVDHTFTS